MKRAGREEAVERVRDISLCLFFQCLACPLTQEHIQISLNEKEKIIGRTQKDVL